MSFGMELLFVVVVAVGVRLLVEAIAYRQERLRGIELDPARPGARRHRPLAQRLRPRSPIVRWTPSAGGQR